MSQSVSNPTDSTIYGSASAPIPTPEQASTLLSCLIGCIADHVGEALRGDYPKACHAETPVADVSPSYGTPPLHVTAIAWTEGAIRSAEVGLLREGDHVDKTLYVDPAGARELAEILLRAAREAEDLARTAREVSA